MYRILFFRTFLSTLSMNNLQYIHKYRSATIKSKKNRTKNAFLAIHLMAARGKFSPKKIQALACALHKHTYLHIMRDQPLAHEQKKNMRELSVHARIVCLAQIAKLWRRINRLYAIYNMKNARNLIFNIARTENTKRACSPHLRAHLLQKNQKAPSLPPQFGSSKFIYSTRSNCIRLCSSKRNI